MTSKDEERYIAARSTEYLRNISRAKSTSSVEKRVSLTQHKKSRINRSRKRTDKVLFSAVKDFLFGTTPNSDHKNVATDCDKFYAVAKEFAVNAELPSVSEGGIDEVGILLLHIMLQNNNLDYQDTCIIAAGPKCVSALKEYFGKVETSLVKVLVQSFNGIITWIEPEQRRELAENVAFWKSGKVVSNSEDGRDDKHMFPFGRVKVQETVQKDSLHDEFGDEYATNFVPLRDTPQLNQDATDTSELSEEDRKIFALFASSAEAEPVAAHSFTPTAAPSTFASAAAKSHSWDRTHLLNLIGNEDILQASITIINSTKSNDEIQDHLFDLLGFEKLELISDILKNRHTIMKNLSREEGLALAHKNKMMSLNSTQAHPVIGVTIKSAEDKYLDKMYRKVEKKSQKAGKMSDVLAGAEDREEAMGIQNNHFQASFRPPSTAMNGTTECSNVYDSFAEIKQKAGFISGQKIILSDNMSRQNTSTYEEISIPPEIKQVPKTALSKELIKISSLDSIGQEVFKGMTNLNRIQTLVFETAYRTNENLLVCAPTGAGKTNIALLSVLQCIKSNIEGGDIMKDQFKIVYVAPMKALASEMTANFSKRLAPLGISVRELTGDMQLTKTEITQTQMLVTTPEKWDVVTRKSTGDVALAQIVKLLIIDEVHLLHGDRGPVVESLVARTLRQVESSQRMIRIVGLSATLPNYRDVAIFLRVNPRVGMFYFDSRFRPVPLGQTFIGVKGLSMLDQQRQMDQCCYEKTYDMVLKGHQVMIFVHARNATIKTAEIMIEIAAKAGQAEAFMMKKSSDESHSNYGKALKSLEKSRNKKLGELFQYGFSVHHAGLLRADRNIVEKLFADGFVRVLVCTATLAWGVNLPAHAVIIKGTEIYDSKQGTFVDLGILDVLQIFGRAGRPQFDKEGHGTIITTHDKLAHYLSLLTNQIPIESNFIKFLTDNLNAEISLGSVSTVEEGMEWLTYTYLYVRMRRNPTLYGMPYTAVEEDPVLTMRRKELIVEAGRSLERAQMIRFDERTEYLHATDMGRTASHYYIKYDTIQIFNQIVQPIMGRDMILMMISKASEFEQLKVRDEELDELDDLSRDYCYLKVWGGSENIHGKVSILIQTFISRAFVKSFSLMSDMQYVTQNAARICRGFFEIVLRQGNPILAARMLEFCKMLDQQHWDTAHPLRQHSHLSPEILQKLENGKMSIDVLKETSPDEIGALLRYPRMGAIVKKCAEEMPALEVDVFPQPITRTVLRLTISIQPNFRWNDRLHGNVSEGFWIWVEDPETNYMYHNEYFIITKRQVLRQEQQEVIFTIPISDPLPPQYLLRIVSDRFLGSTQSIPVSFQHLILPEQHPPHTNLLDLDPLPVTALKDTRFELLYGFQFFNPIQTQIFHSLYHTDSNVLVGAPTGSGKTIAAELAMFRVFRVYPGAKVVYIAPLKALVRERITDWKERLQGRLGKKVIELTGDVTPDARAIAESDVIVTTPEKWDGISRSWQTRTYVQAVALIVIDEIHLLGEDRGPVLEVIVSRTNFISQYTEKKLRVVGLSTALANARDLADWLGIKGFEGLFNFRPSCRPVPIQVHISGFPGKHYCPRMATMNKPAYQAIREHSPAKPVLIFVSSRRQTRLTALDLIAYLAGDGNPKQWLHMDEHEIEHIIQNVKESNLKLTLSFGIGIHHAGLQETDRKVVEELFVNRKIQVLIATATLAWGVNFPAHLVVIKGTEYYDGKTHRYVDMPITDVLQMMGRAGRPQFDTEGVAVVLVHDQKKNFYKKFLYEPFPVESSLLEVLPDHLNAEVVAGTITTNQEALNYLTCTYFFRRLLQNPSYYQLETSNPSDVNKHLSNLVSSAFQVLERASCLYIHDDLRTVEPTSFGRIAAYYYLSHQTMRHFRDCLGPNYTLEDLLNVMTLVNEYAQLPVRHNEDLLNEKLAKDCPIEVAAGSYNSPHTKAHLLIQCHFSRLQLPSSDYYTDLKSVLDQALRILQAMIDACAENGWLLQTLRCINLIQMIVQARWLDDDAFMSLPFVDEMGSVALAKKFKVDTIPQLQCVTKGASMEMQQVLMPYLEEPKQFQLIYKTLHEIPVISLKIGVEFEGKRVPLPLTGGSPRSWVDLPVGKELALILHLTRKNAFPKDMKVLAPKFSKAKDEGWFIVLGDLEKMDVVALKRGGGVKRTMSQQLRLDPVLIPGRVIYNLYLMSDAYLGVDYQYELCLNFVNS